jgi:hypothetical protein
MTFRYLQTVVECRLEAVVKKIQFETVLGADRVIRPPADIALPEGVIEVTIRPMQPPTIGDSTPLASARDWLLKCAAEAEQSAPSLPCDMAEHHDHYAHGMPLP